jgi:hypothetical protein
MLFNRYIEVYSTYSLQIKQKIDEKLDAEGVAHRTVVNDVNGFMRSTARSLVPDIGINEKHMLEYKILIKKSDMPKLSAGFFDSI